MIKKFSDYDSTQAYGAFQSLPKGAYMLVIKGVKVEHYRNGDSIKLAVDVAEGEYAGYYKKEFENSKQENKKWRGVYLINVPADDGTDKDNKIKRWFKTTMEAFESSNPGYKWNWDENSLKGKKIVGLFVIREYIKNDGSIGKSTSCRKLISIADYESGNYQMPSDELMEPNEPFSGEGFVPVDSVASSDLPF